MKLGMTLLPPQGKNNQPLCDRFQSSSLLFKLVFNAKKILGNATRKIPCEMINDAASFTGYQEKNTDIKVIIFVTKIIRKEMR